MSNIETTTEAAPNRSLKRSWVADNARDYIGSTNLPSRWRVTLSEIRQYAKAEQLDAWAKDLADSFGLTPPWFATAATATEAEVEVEVEVEEVVITEAMVAVAEEAEEAEEVDEFEVAMEILRRKAKSGGVDVAKVQGLINDSIAPLQDDVAEISHTVNRQGHHMDTRLDDIMSRVNKSHDEVFDQFKDIRSTMDEIGSVLSAAPPSVRHRVAAAISGSSSAALTEQAVAFIHYASPGAATSPVAVYGEPGVSKTYDAIRHSEDFDHVEVVGGHDGLGIMQVIGSPMLYGDKVINIYGHVARAFMAAREGKTTLLIMDEFTRLNPRIKAIFVTALNVRVDPTGEPCYVLQLPIPKMNEDGTPSSELEEIWAPKRMLAVIATANEGKGFNTNMDDPAERGRWHKIRVQYNSATSLNITESLLKAAGFEEWRGKFLIGLIDSCRKANFDGNMFTQPATLRDVVRAIECATDSESVLKELHDRLVGQIISLDGKNLPNKAQVSALESLFSTQVDAMAAYVAAVKMTESKKPEVHSYAIEVGMEVKELRICEPSRVPASPREDETISLGGATWTFMGGRWYASECPKDMEACYMSPCGEGVYYWHETSGWLQCGSTTLESATAKRAALIGYPHLSTE